MSDPLRRPQEHRAKGAIPGTLPVSCSESGFPVALGKPICGLDEAILPSSPPSHCCDLFRWLLLEDTMRFPQTPCGDKQVFYGITQGHGAGCQWAFSVCIRSVATTAVLGRSLMLLNPVDFPAELSGLALKSHTQRNVLFSILLGSLLAFLPPRREQNIGRRVGHAVPLETASLA